MRLYGDLGFAGMPAIGRRGDGRDMGRAETMSGCGSRRLGEATLGGWRRHRMREIDAGRRASGSDRHRRSGIRHLMRCRS